jgi:hypothetical protein
MVRLPSQLITHVFTNFLSIGYFFLFVNIAYTRYMERSMESHSSKNTQNPEHQISVLEPLENKLLLARKLETVYNTRPDILSFIGTQAGTQFEKEYSMESVQSDLKYTEETRKKIDEQNSSFGRENLDKIEGGFQLSEIMQAMIVDRINHKWFKDVRCIMTSDYDDLHSGIDAVMKHQEGGVLGASFDFTVSQQEKIIYKKLMESWDDVNNGRVSTIKYFEDPDTHEKGKLIVPKFIIGASKKDLEDLAAGYLNNNQELLDNHPFKYVMLLQIEEQLNTILDYHAVNEDDPKLAFARKQYGGILKLLRKLKEEIHINEDLNANIDLYEYSKKSVALDTMRRFRVGRDTQIKNNLS